MQLSQFLIDGLWLDYLWTKVSVVTDSALSDCSHLRESGKVVCSVGDNPCESFGLYLPRKNNARTN